MPWTPTDMSDRIFMDRTLRVTNQGLYLGVFVFIDGEWGFVLNDAGTRAPPVRRDLYRKCCAPYVRKFIDDQLTALNVMQRLKS